MKGANAESTWYRSVVELHGRAAVAVGSVAWSEEQAYWVSSTDEDEATSDEHATFYEALQEKLDAFSSVNLSDVTDPLQRPYIAGDFFCCRSEELLLDPHALCGRVDDLAGAVEVIQCHLAGPCHRRWRVGYFHGDATLLIYPDAIFVGPHRFERAQLATDLLGRWLEFLKDG